MMMTRNTLLLGLAALLLVAGCSDSTGPVIDGDSVGSVDPGNRTFTLKTLMAVPPEGDPVPLILESTGVEVMRDGMTVALGVTVRNGGDRPVGASLIIWIDGFDRDDVSVGNPDIVAPSLPGEPLLVGFDYSELLGDDGMLEPGEASEAKRWEFRDPGQGPFWFSGRAEGGFGPPRARIEGRCFLDWDLDGAYSPDEFPFTMAAIHLTSPSGREVSLLPDVDGMFGTRVSETGLYTLLAVPMNMGPERIDLTTPNPLYIVLTPGPEGFIQGYREADFGFAVAWPPPLDGMVHFTDEPADSLHYGSWSFIEADIGEPGLLDMHVGYSGCELDQPFRMYAVGGFMESMPPQLNLLLVHEVEQDCDAAFENTFTFDLAHVYREALNVYGPGELTLNLLGFDGEIVERLTVFIGLD